jgi:hypothetical protein
MNLAETLGEDVSSFFSPEQVSEMQDTVAEKLRRFFINISNIIETAIDDGKIEHTAELDQLPAKLRTLMEYIPQ